MLFLEDRLSARIRQKRMMKTILQQERFKYQARFKQQKGKMLQIAKKVKMRLNYLQPSYIYQQQYMHDGLSIRLVIEGVDKHF